MVTPGLATAGLIGVPFLLGLAALAQVSRRPLAAQAARLTALAAALVTGAGVAQGASPAVHLFDGIHLDDIQLGVVLGADGLAAAALVLLTTLAALGFWATPTPAMQTRAAAAGDLACLGAASVVLAGGWLPMLIGYELCAGGIGLAAIAHAKTAAAGRRVLVLLRLGGAGLAGGVLLAPGSWPIGAANSVPIAAALALPAVAVLVGLWPVHARLADTLRTPAGLAVHVAAAVAGLLLYARTQPSSDPGSLLHGVLAGAAVLATIAGLATSSIGRSRSFTAAAQAAVTLIVASVSPGAALLLLTGQQAAQLALGAGLTLVDESVPGGATRLRDVGGLAGSLPWPRWLCAAAAVTGAVAIPALWGPAAVVAALIPIAPALGGVAAVVLAAPALPLARLAVAPFAGPPRHTTLATVPSPWGRRVAAAIALVLAAIAAPLLSWGRLPAPDVMAAAITAGVSVLLLAAGFVGWRRGTGPAAAPAPRGVALAGAGFGVHAGFALLGRATVAAASFLWTTVDSAIVGLAWAGLDAAGRGSGWLLARAHAGWTGWAVAAALGTGALVLWSGILWSGSGP